MAEHGEVGLDLGGGGGPARSDIAFENTRRANERLIRESNERDPVPRLVGNIWNEIQSQAREQGKILNWSQAMYNNQLDLAKNAVQQFTKDYLQREIRRGAFNLDYYDSQEGFRALFEASWNRFATINRSFGEILPPGGSGRSGPSGPTAQDIRNSFDLNSLAQTATQIWRQMLFTAPKDANAIASAYVDVVVKGKGEKNVDFNAFVRSRAMSTGRFAVIFKDKPEGMSPEQYLGQYTGSAAAVVRPGNVESVALGGARLGSDAGTFQSRLARSNENITSAPFITNLEARVQNLSEVLRG